ncbi:hypothetical protein AAFP30_17975 [Gordonia sp. CPCC 205515]|uniref:hypothetical protein n=1 Tax=Gordonia sp. CPCC 205515 TaxID=3140791 RepID=UPI003AF33272
MDNEVPRDVAVVVGAVAFGVRMAVGATRVAAAGTRLALRLPVVGPIGQRGIDRLAADGQRVLAHAPEVIDRGKALVVVVISAILAELDLTALVRDNVDLNEVAAGLDIYAILDRVDLNSVITERVDLDAAVANVDLDKIAAGLDIDAILNRVDLDEVATRINIDAILDRVDLIGLANDIIDGVDLTSIIRDASTSVTADVMIDVRSSGERADDAVANVVNRFLHRRQVVVEGETPPAIGGPSGE